MATNKLQLAKTRNEAIKQLNLSRRGIWKSADTFNIDKKVVDELVGDGLLLKRTIENKLHYRYKRKTPKVDKPSENFIKSLIG